MKMKFLTWLGALLLMLTASGSTWAANMTCTMLTTPAGTPATTYSPYTANNTALTYTVRCTRTANGGGTLSYKIGNDNGQNQGGAATNRASFTSGGTTYYVPYDLYTNSNTTCGGTQWVTSTDLADSLTWSGSIRTIDTPHTFYLCIPTFTGATFPIAGTYTDTVLLNLNTPVPSSGDTFSPAAPNPFATLIVSITVAKECALLTTTLGTVDFGTYTALTNGIKTANTPFVSRCTNQGTYSMALDNVNGVVAGLNYTLGLNTVAGSTGAATLAAVGTGAVAGQTFYINGSMPGGQAGSCSGTACTATGASATHTLTITY